MCVMEFILIPPLHPTETDTIIMKWANAGLIEKRKKEGRPGGLAEC